MQPAEFEQLYRFERTYWWHLGRLRLLESLLDEWLPKRQGNTILDFGCGTGGNLTTLRKYGDVTGVDVSKQAVEACRRDGFENVIRIKPNVPLPFADQSYNLITTLDVLEHVDDDVAALRDLHRVLTPGGLLVVFVPAYEFLWSEHDEALQHKRRYLASYLHARMNVAGFQVLKRTYAISLSFPLIVGYRWFKGLFPSKVPASTSYVPLPAFLNELLLDSVMMEADMIRRMNLPVGTSVLAVGRKTEPATEPEED
ncbi:MAG TPA: class I SAM-dependent methyltransferase [Candidatus Xenobia bacterium]|jgi:SAM-dependent methyltransferase